MVNKSKILILSIFIFSLAFFLYFAVFLKNSLACSLKRLNDNVNTICYIDNQCIKPTNDPVYDFIFDAGGCVMAYSLGQLPCRSIGFPMCSPDAKWYTSPSYDRQICKRRSGSDCNASVNEGNWDSSDSKCVVCDSYRREIGYFDCSGDYNGDYECESACGADPACDERYPNGMYDTDGNGYFDLYCDNSCYAYKCNASTECISIVWYGNTFKCSYYYYSTSSPRYDWLSPPPHEGSPWQSCFDNHDNDCDGYKDCADPECRTVQNPNTGVICCQSDSDCPSKNNIKGKCDTTGGITSTPYTCYWPPCGQDSDCVLGTYCYCGVCSSSFTSEGCTSGQCCDRGYGGAAPGQCVSKGTIRNIASVSYLCDSS